MSHGQVDYARSRAVLIGVGEYRDSAFTPVPAALNNVIDLRRALTDPLLGGWPGDRVSVIMNPADAGSVMVPLAEIAQATDDVLLVYYVGHGKLDEKAELCLTVQSTQAPYPVYTGISYGWVSTIMRTSPARVKIMILDCCYAGRAILGDPSTDFADMTAVEGAYTLTATAGNQPALTPPPQAQHDSHTSFTGEFLDLLATGVPGGPADLTLGFIYPHLKRRLAARGLPLPNQRGTDTVTHYAFARNVAVRRAGKASPPAAGSPRPAVSPHVPGLAWPADSEDDLTSRVREVIRSLAAEGWPEPIRPRDVTVHEPPPLMPPARSTGGGLQLLPFYLVCDESASMAGAPIDAINSSLPDVHAEIGSNPVVADKTRFCLIGYSDQAEVLLPLADLSTLTSMPKLQAGGGTRYGPALDLLFDTISRDAAELDRAGHTVYRPAVFFLAGSPPDDDWLGSLARVTDPAWPPRPNILAFGFGLANYSDMSRIATVKAFMADGTMGPADALREFAEALIRSIVIFD